MEVSHYVFLFFRNLCINVMADLRLRHTFIGCPLCITMSCVVEPLIGIANKLSLMTIGNGPGCGSRMRELVYFIDELHYHTSHLSQRQYQHIVVMPSP